ncbi:hypothetical protein ACOME3_009499 [Neoechinorhynchus agilis]
MKTEFMLKLCSAQKRYCLFLDDDYVLNIKNLIKEIKRIRSSVLMGFSNTNARPVRVRTNKWYVPISRYPFNSYLPYLSGGCILLTSDVAATLVKDYNLEDCIFDDVYIGILAYRNRIALNHNQKFANYFLTQKLKSSICMHLEQSRVNGTLCQTD